jgi:hypothetical protein
MEPHICPPNLTHPSSIKEELKRENEREGEFKNIKKKTKNK